MFPHGNIIGSFRFRKGPRLSNRSNNLYMVSNQVTGSKLRLLFHSKLYIPELLVIIETYRLSGVVPFIIQTSESVPESFIYVEGWKLEKILLTSRCDTFYVDIL